MSKKYDMVIDGGKVSAKDQSQSLDRRILVGLAPQAKFRPFLRHAVAAANKAFLKWSKLPDAVRLASDAAANKSASTPARLLTEEQGKPLNGMGSRFELGGVQAWGHYTADIPMPAKVLQDNNEGRIELHSKPIGVVGSITPWNGR